MSEQDRIIQLRKELHEHNYRYYVLNQPVIDDQAFDMLMRELQDLEARHPDMYDPNSPTMSRRWPNGMRRLRNSLRVNSLRFAAR